MQLRTLPDGQRVGKASGKRGASGAALASSSLDLFFRPFLPFVCRKYSCGLWPEGCDSLEASEEEALRVVCERAKITNTK